MLSPEPMRHLSLVVLTSDLENASRAIARVGVLHLLDVRHAVDTLSPIRPYDVRERVAHLTALSQQVAGLMKFLGVEEPDVPVAAAPEDAIDLSSIEARVAAISAAADQVKAGSAALVEQREQLQVLLQNVRAAEPLGVPFEELQGLRYVHVISGRMPVRNLPRLREALAHVPHLIVPGSSEGEDGRLFVTLVCLRADLPRLIPMPQSAI